MREFSNRRMRNVCRDMTWDDVEISEASKSGEPDDDRCELSMDSREQRVL